MDVEWAHAIAPGAQIILVEANSQSLPDLMAAAATAAAQPGVSVVTMSWGFPEGQAVFAADEADYDNVFNVPGVTFLASTGDYGAADPEYPAFSPNVVAVGGTTLNLNADNSYNSETGWGYYSDAMGASIGSGGGLSLYEPEPSYQQGVQSTGSRTTPDVSMFADPGTGAWIADPYNLDASNPFEVAGGTSLAAPAWAGLMAMVNQGRVAAGEATLNSSGPNETQQALYSLPQADYNVIGSGNNGYAANSGYNLVSGLGTPVAGALVPALVAYSGPGTTYSGPTVGPLQDATLVASGMNGGDPSNVFFVFNALTSAGGFGAAKHRAATPGTSHQTAPIQDVNGSQGPDEGGTPTEPGGPLVLSSVATPTAPASDGAAVEMSAIDDALAAHDAALIGWSSRGLASPKRAAVRSNAGTASPVPTVTGPLFWRGRTAVLQGKPIAPSTEGLGTPTSLLALGRWTSPGPRSNLDRPIP